jgi:hypothetical protein
LYLHEVHARLGFELVAHPPGPGNTHPDFLVSRDEQHFYLAYFPRKNSWDTKRPRRDFSRGRRGEWLLLSKERLGVFHRSRTESVSAL